MNSRQLHLCIPAIYSPLLPPEEHSDRARSRGTGPCKGRSCSSETEGSLFSRKMPAGGVAVAASSLALQGIMDPQLLPKSCRSIKHKERGIFKKLPCQLLFCHLFLNTVYLATLTAVIRAYKACPINRKDGLWKGGEHVGATWATEVNSPFP